MKDSYHDKNRRKFSQTSNTPLIHGQKSQGLGFNSISEICLKILQGHYNVPPCIDDYITAYIKHPIRALNIIEPPQAIVPTKIFQEGWSKMKEHTSSGISVLHFWTPQSMFTFALTFIFRSLPFPYPLHNRICTRVL